MDGFGRRDAAVLADLTRVLADLVDAGALGPGERSRLAVALSADEETSLCSALDGLAERLSATS